MNAERPRSLERVACPFGVDAVVRSCESGWCGWEVCVEILVVFGIAASGAVAGYLVRSAGWGLAEPGRA